MAVYEIKLEEASLHVSKGNNKIGKGIYSFSTLPGNADHILTLKTGEQLTNIPGTCSKYCEGCAKDGSCYAWRDAKLHHNVVIKAWGENTLLLREDPDNLFNMIDTFITEKNSKPFKVEVATWRWNVSGEIESLKQLELMNNLAIKHPEVMFGVYTKNYDVLEEFIAKHGAPAIAENFVINISEWHGVARKFLNKYPGVFNVFEYDDSNRKDCDLSEEEKARLAKLPHCPAVTKDGHHATNKDGKPITCDGCTHCYRKTGRVTAVYAH